MAFRIRSPAGASDVLSETVMPSAKTAGVTEDEVRRIAQRTRRRLLLRQNLTCLDRSLTACEEVVSERPATRALVLDVLDSLATTAALLQYHGSPAMLPRLASRAPRVGDLRDAVWAAEAAILELLAPCQADLCVIDVRDRYED